MGRDPGIMRNYEIEIRYVINDVTAFKDTLEKNGYAVVVKESQINTYYEHPFFPGMIAGKKYLRVRRVGRMEEVAFSSPTTDAAGVETRKQFTFTCGNPRFDSPSRSDEFLSGIGFMKTLSIEKDRETWSMLKDRVGFETSVHFEIDYNISVRSLVEKPKKIMLEDTVQSCIEITNNTRENNDVATKKLAAISLSLGLKPEDIIEKDYFDRYFEKAGKVTK